MQSNEITTNVISLSVGPGGPDGGSGAGAIAVKIKRHSLLLSELQR